VSGFGGLGGARGPDGARRRPGRDDADVEGSATEIDPRQLP
jgi:hypothetical protein